jgi:NTE family protein
VQEGITLVDGGLVNPVPVSLARAMGADIVIAVDLGSDILGRHLRVSAVADSPSGPVGEWVRKLQSAVGTWLPSRTVIAPNLPSMLNVLASSLNIMQVRITRSRMAGEPPDAVVAPRLAHFGLMDFHRASDAIEEGRRAATAIIPALRLLGI